jgi:hypothetical protein
MLLELNQRLRDWPEKLGPEELDRNWRYPLLKPERLSENLKAAEK